MEVETADAILGHHDGLRSWPQPFLFSTPDGVVDLSVAIGDNACTPENVGLYQPDQYPSWPYHKPVYRFDPHLYCGEKDQTSLLCDVRSCLPGVNFFSNSVNGRNSYTSVRLVCSFSKKLSKNTLYRDECFMKFGVPVEPRKVRETSTFKRLDNAKLKRKKKNKQTVDNRGGKRRPHVEDPTVRKLPRIHAHCATYYSGKCSVSVSLVMCACSGHWYLSSKGNLNHILHVQKHAVYESITTKDLDVSEINLMNILFREEMNPSVIGRVMECLREQKGQRGRFRSKNVSNAANRHRAAIDLAMGIEKDWKTAQRTITKLEKLGISYYALYMDKNDDVFAQKCRGRPSSRQSEELRTHGVLKSELRQLRKDLSMENGTEILLSFSIATTDMQRAVHMHPEVIYMDVISNSNKQKRDLFLLVVKDASGETNIGNASVLPCGKKMDVPLCLPQIFPLSLWSTHPFARALSLDGR